MSTHVPGFQAFFRVFLHLFVLVRLVTISIRDKASGSCGVVTHLVNCKMKRCPDPSPPPCSCHTSRADHGPPLVGAAQASSQTGPSQCPQTYPQDPAHQGTAIKKYTHQHHKQAHVNALKHTPRIPHIRGLQSRNTPINITNRPMSMPSNIPPGSRTSRGCNQEIYRSTSLACIVLWANFSNSLP